MLAVSAAELASIQAEAVKAVCDKTCQVYRDLTFATPDIYGSSSSSPADTASYTLMSTTVAGVAQPTATHLQNYDFLIGSEASWLVHLPVATDVQHRDHLVIDGQILEVHVILTPRSYEALRGVLAAEIK